jgi:putative transposase
VIQALAATYPVSTICTLWNFPRSTYYHPRVAKRDAELRHALEELAAEWPTYGSRRLTAELRRNGWRVNRKRIQRLMREMGLQRPKKRRQRRTTQSQHSFPRYPNLVKDLAITHPDQVWVADITYIHWRQDEVYLAVIMDVYTRSLRGWHWARGLGEELTLTALKRALQHHCPEIHHSDQGLQYTATHYVELLKQCQVQISMAEVGEATQNGYAERLIRTIKEEAVDLSDYRDYPEAYQQIGRFLDDVYMHKRIHSSLGYLTPIEFENLWLNRHPSQSMVKFETPFGCPTFGVQYTCCKSFHSYIYNGPKNSDTKRGLNKVVKCHHAKTIF